jgi:hypothetical protein
MNVGTLKRLIDNVDDDLIVCFFDSETELPVELDQVTAPATEDYFTVNDDVVTGRVMLLGHKAD